MLYDEVKRWRIAHDGTGNDSNLVAEERYNSAFCDGQIQSVVEACNYDGLQLRALGIHYATDFCYPDAPGHHANTSKDLARIEDVHFDFYRFTRDFENIDVHFDYVIKVFHDRTSGKSPHSIVAFANSGTHRSPQAADLREKNQRRCYSGGILLPSAIEIRSRTTLRTERLRAASFPEHRG